MASPLTVGRGEHAPAAPSPRSATWKFAAVGLALAAAGGGLFYSGRARSLLKSLRLPEPHAAAAAVPAATSKARTANGWDNLVRVSADEQEAIGFRFAPVKPQTEPIRLELTGRTAYDTNTITKVRPRFDTRVEKVLVEIGQKIRKGDPLVELYSTDLASAKSDFQTKYVQWQHDLKLLNLRRDLIKSGAIAQQLWVDTQNDEQKSRLDYVLARDKLTIFYEVPQDEVDPLIERLVGEKPVDPKNFGNVTNKARMVLRAKTDGYVILRDVVPSNYYESTDTLMEIAPLDHLWVWVNVFEVDQDKVRVGQALDIRFPFMAQRIPGHVDYVASEVSKDTRAVKVRATIPNPEARLKSDMLVKAMLEIPPVPGQTVVPRLSMVAGSSGEFVFVRVPRPSVAPKGRGADRFERIKIAVAQENTTDVVVARGLTQDQEVVTNGSLILAQLYEDQRVTTTGLPAE